MSFKLIHVGILNVCYLHNQYMSQYSTCAFFIVNTRRNTQRVAVSSQLVHVGILTRCYLHNWYMSEYWILIHDFDAFFFEERKGACGRDIILCLLNFEENLYKA